MERCAIVFCFVTVMNLGWVCCVQNGVMLCGKLDTKGFTMPSGDLIMVAGSSLNITCSLYDNYENKYGPEASSRLYFERNGKVLPKEMYEIVNATSIRLHVDNLTVSENDNYFCLLNVSKKEGTFVCMNAVMVGLPPQEVTDFNCISYNYENMTCSWTRPNNYVNTEYSLSYTMKKRIMRKFVYFCNPLIDNNKMHCFWNASTSPPYRQVYSTFYFTLNITNIFGNRVQNFTFEHFKHVLPNPPFNLRAEATAPNAIKLNWEIPQPMQLFKAGLHHRVIYQCQYEKKWYFGGLRKTIHKEKSVEFNLTNLKYAHDLCDIRVAIRSAVADDDDESMWSENATRTVRTLSKKPVKPPRTTPGSFEVINSASTRDVKIYYQQIEDYEKSGPEFGYIVEVNDEPTIVAAEIKNSYAKFKDLHYKDYVFNVWSKNKLGLSEEKSTLFLPAITLDQPLSFVKMAHNDGLFELSWEPPRSSSLITNYTVFWCNSDRERPYPCTGKLDWAIVPSTKNRYNQTLPSTTIYQFAVAANGLSSSSGMLWAGCTVLVSKDQGKLTSVWISAVGSDFIEVKWAIECPGYIGPAEGFVITYCEIAQASHCVGEEHNQTFLEKSVRSGRVINLKPYTTYQLYVRVKLANNTFSAASKIMRNTTSEAAPSPPLNMEVTEVGEDFIKVRWEAPLKANGAKLNYKVYYNNDYVKLDKDDREVLLQNLNSYTLYTIGVAACTNAACTNVTDFREAQTKMSIPSQIKTPYLYAGSNNTLVIIKWDLPEYPRGNVAYYQLHLMQQLTPSNETDDRYLNVTKSREFSFTCDNSPSYVSVRAVNVENDKHYYGPWSLPAKLYPCSPPTKIWLIVIIVSIIAVVIVLFLAGKKMFTCVNKMKKVEVKLPPGLEPVVWMPERRDEADGNSGADQMLLHDKFSGNESGISSGHESIASSTADGANSQISASDSGNEQARSIMSEDDRKNSLRQRNVKGYVLPDVLSAKKTQKVVGMPGNYCVLGLAKQEDNDKDAEIVFSEDLRSPYVMAGEEMIKTSNPGYVPYEVGKPAEKSTGYVMAGDIRQYNSALTPSEDDVARSFYVKAGDDPKNVTTFLPSWPKHQPPPAESTVPKTGYVSVGDVPQHANVASNNPKAMGDIVKGYVPHQQFEAKSLKED